MSRAFAHRAISLAGLAVRMRRSARVAAHRPAVCLTLRVCAAQLGSVVTFLWLVALKPKKKED
jgi:hypothetical protein